MSAATLTRSAELAAVPIPRVRRSDGGFDLHLKLFVVALFLPEGLSIFVGDFRLPAVRLLLIVFALAATTVFLRNASASRSALVPSDVIALGAGVWMVIAGIVTDGFGPGLKGGSALALEFTGAYYVFRRMLYGPDSSVRIVRFACIVMVPVIGLALMDPFTGHLFVHDAVARLTGYHKLYSPDQDSYFRNGLFRAMGPVEHSILFGTACAWFATLAFGVFRLSAFAIGFTLLAMIGIWFSQSKGPLLAYALSMGLFGYYFATRRFAARWKLVGAALVACLTIVFTVSNNPIATLLRLGGLDPASGWYREVIWRTAGPLVLDSPLFGIGISTEWDWRQSDVLVGPTVDALWLAASMMFGIPGAVLVALTLAGAFWRGPVDRCEFLTEHERRLSVALGITTFSAVFLGFTVHFWGTCWILLGALAGMRAHLAEVALVRMRDAHGSTAGCNPETARVTGND